MLVEPQCKASITTSGDIRIEVCLPLLFELFFFGVVYKTVSIAAFFSCYSTLFSFGTVFL